MDKQIFSRGNFGAAVPLARRQSRAGTTLLGAIDY
jgi:hypothetical protein